MGVYEENIIPVRVIAALKAKDKFIPYVEQKRIEQKAKTKR